MSDPDPATGERGDGAGGRVRALLARRRPLAESLGHLRRPLAASVGTFAAFAVVGYLVVGPAVVGDASLCSGSGSGVVTTDTTVSYFVNNMGTAFIMMGGVGVLTLAALAYNGVLLGAAVYVSLTKGLGLAALSAALVPHAIIEIPGLLVAGGIGYFLGGRVGGYLIGRREELAVPEDEVHLAQLFVLVVGLILVAAAVEARLTPAVIEWVSGGLCP